MSQPLICQVGEALYGPHWVRPLASALEVSERTMRYWQDGKEPPDGIWADCARLCRERVKLLERLGQKLSA